MVLGPRTGWFSKHKKHTGEKLAMEINRQIKACRYPSVV